MAGQMGTATQPGTGTAIITLSQADFHNIEQQRREFIRNANLQGVLACDFLKAAGRASWTPEQVIGYYPTAEMGAFNDAVEVWRAGGLENLKNVGVTTRGGR